MDEWYDDDFVTFVRDAPTKYDNNVTPEEIALAYEGDNWKAPWLDGVLDRILDGFAVGVVFDSVTCPICGEVVM